MIVLVRTVNAVVCKRDARDLRRLAVRLRHVDGFIRLALLERGLDIHLMNIKVTLGRQAENNSNRSELGN